MIHQEILREAIREVRAHAQTGIACADGRRGPPNGNEIWNAILAVCRAAESTLSKTKMVEVWRVEWATETGIVHAQHFTMEGNAQSHARSLRKNGMECIRVTGPHQQEVPA